MSKFKVGDRVRIVFDCPRKGKEATVWKVGVWKKIDAVDQRPGTFGPAGEICYYVDIDGVGRIHADNANYFAYESADLIPLVPPDELAWQQFREHLKPNPLVIFDADPIIVSTDEEAERIAETVPNSHIKVVIRGVVVSEYYGQSQSNRP